ncbi:hypothetical protein F8568_001720 [Actinomadura sp. LD22]|uniref:Uncharacterized protein n=1 Tax=Actinomadura physcomitrii TaxID=2650748 RepID=A0A6I4M470_9ACTN|nr:hypothetical protein [Actinomadura physcomitrii]MVZ99124.1 hypothetical protein [Actinomadura physcomitrii]
MSRDTHPGVQCPHCHSHLALVPVPGNNAPAAVPAPPPTPPSTAPPAAVSAQVSVPPVTAKEEWQPPPVAEVLAAYAGRVKDSATAMRGAARVRDSLNRARTAAAQRRAAQRTARRTPKSA